MSGQAFDDPQARHLFELGARLFNQGEYFQAHEAWEDLWHMLPAETNVRTFVQGLVQCAVALEHVRRGNPRGALMLLERIEKRWASLPDQMLGIDRAGLLQAMRKLLAPLRELPIATMKPRQRTDRLPVNLAEAPRIEVGGHTAG